MFQNSENVAVRTGSLPPTQEATACNMFPAESIGSLPPSDLSIQGNSLGVTSSDIDTQVIVDLMKGPTDSARLDGKDILGIL
jgi:hypothetical protein